MVIPIIGRKFEIIIALTNLHGEEIIKIKTKTTKRKKNPNKKKL